MRKELPLPRLLATSNEADGRSSFLSDAPAHAVRTVDERPGYRVSNHWISMGAPAPFHDSDRIAELA